MRVRFINTILSTRQNITRQDKIVRMYIREIDRWYFYIEKQMIFLYFLYFSVANILMKVSIFDWPHPTFHSDSFPQIHIFTYNKVKLNLCHLRTLTFLKYIIHITCLIINTIYVNTHRRKKNSKQPLFGIKKTNHLF